MTSSFDISFGFSFSFVKIYRETVLLGLSFNLNGCIFIKKNMKKRRKEYQNDENIFFPKFKLIGLENGRVKGSDRNITKNGLC